MTTQGPVSQSSVTTSSNGTQSGVPSASTQSQLVQQASNTLTGLKTPNSNTTDGSMDYIDRKSVLASKDAQGIKKVALVGRYGAGTQNIWTGQTQAAKQAAKSGNNNPDYSTVIFKVTPQLSESGQVSAVDIGEIRSAGSIIVYMGSPSRIFNITAKFVSRTTDEATSNWTDINVLKAWRMPQGTGDEPETLRLFAYDKTLKGIPCLMKQISIEWPEDVDYIQASNGSPVPIIQTVSISLQEIRNSEDIQKFDYASFKQGALDTW